MLTFSDGRYIGAILDRNGLRPARYYLTNDDHLYMSSEVGVNDHDVDSIIKKVCLASGRNVRGAVFLYRSWVIRISIFQLYILVCIVTRVRVWLAEFGACTFVAGALLFCGTVITLICRYFWEFYKKNVIEHPQRAIYSHSLWHTAILRKGRKQVLKQ